MDSEAAFSASLRKLGLEHVDLYLIHAPWPWTAIGTDHTAGNIEVWKVFEELYSAGRTRSIGVSNFSVDDLEKLTAATEVVPHANQIRWFVGNTQEDVTAWCQAHGVLVEGYSPLATGQLLEDGALDEVAQRVGRTPAQVAIRYLLEKGVLPLPKSVTPKRIAENAQVHFTLDAEAIATLDAIQD